MVLQTKRDTIGREVKVVIVNNSVLETVVDKLEQKKFGCIIFDESQVLKNFKTKVATAAQQLAKGAKRVVLLSGTPALSRPSELFTQLELLDPNFFTFKEYSSRYCAGKQTNFGWNASGE
jgi:SWI/SNF-related matrix-associated actin-dependent regulator 1 of chromatin subfamily A